MIISKLNSKIDFIAATPFTTGNVALSFISICYLPKYLSPFFVFYYISMAFFSYTARKKMDAAILNGSKIRFELPYCIISQASFLIFFNVFSMLLLVLGAYFAANINAAIIFITAFAMVYDTCNRFGFYSRLISLPCINLSIEMKTKLILLLHVFVFSSILLNVFV